MGWTCTHCKLFDSDDHDWCEVIPHCGFDLHFPSIYWCWALLHVSVNHLHIFFGIIFRFSAYILLGCLIFVLSCISFLHILDINLQSIASSANIFSCSIGRHLSLCWQFPLLQNHLHLTRAHLFVAFLFCLRRLVQENIAMIYINVLCSSLGILWFQDLNLCL